MNAVLDRIYGTSGLEKSAAAGQEGPETLSDLALYLTYDEAQHGNDLTKVASAHKSVFDQLVAFDRAGRAMAQAEFSELEKAASEGNLEPMQAFAGHEAAPTDEDRKAALALIDAEIAKRAAK